jgi:Putative transposase
VERHRQRARRGGAHCPSARGTDGTTAVVMTKAVLMERLCALVPKPRKHLVTYHGVLAPASGLRSRVVPRRVEEAGEAGGCQHGAGDGPARQEAAAAVVGKAVENVAVAAFRRQQAERRVRARLRVPHGDGSRRSGRRRYSWAELLQRTLGIEVLVCPKCSGLRRVLAAIHDPASIARVLGSMGLPLAVPEQAGCRAPPAGEEFGSDSECVAE